MSDSNVVTNLTSIFPEDVCHVLVHETDDVLNGIELHPAELALAESFKNIERKNAFILGRLAARLALAKIGVESPVERGSLDEPLWPEGVIGSISHTGTIALCVVAKSGKFNGLGVDIEFTSKEIDPKIEKRICTPTELKVMPTDEEQRAIKLLEIFCAKEAYYKAIFPTVKKYLGFRDVELTWNEDRFEGRIINPKIGKEGNATGKVHYGEYLVSFCST